jgi:hypothetical protein
MDLLVFFGIWFGLLAFYFGVLVVVGWVLTRDEEASLEFFENTEKKTLNTRYQFYRQEWEKDGDWGDFDRMLEHVELEDPISLSLPKIELPREPEVARYVEARKPDEKCYCDYCRGRAGVHGKEAIALYRAQVDALK